MRHYCGVARVIPFLALAATLLAGCEQLLGIDDPVRIADSGTDGVDGSPVDAPGLDAGADADTDAPTGTGECAIDNGGCGDPVYWECMNNDGAPPTCTAIDLCATDNGGCGATHWICTNNPGADPSCTPASVPPARSDHRMAYDLARGRAVLFGGHIDGVGEVNDTWEWNGIYWTERNPVAAPLERREHAMAYDALNNRVVLFGGWIDGLHSGDTWEWNGSAWTERSPVNAPPARAGHAMVYDEERSRIVLFGGWDLGGTRDDTWEWDGSSWTERTSVAAPPAREGHAMAYDVERGRVVLFGGFAPGAGGALSDTWEWDGSNWTERTPANSPASRMTHAMAYDVVRGRVVVFGGWDGDLSMTADDTWEWDGVDWHVRDPGTTPLRRTRHAMAYDSLSARIVVFGGLDAELGIQLGDTWLWDGTDWVE